MNKTLLDNLKQHYLEEDEIDLVKLVSSSADVTNQYIIIEGANAELYALNVAKVEELVPYKDIQILKNNNKESFIKGTAEIREHMTPLVYFDEWFGNELLDESEYDLVVLCYFSQKYIGIIVKQVIEIMSIEPSEMYPNADNNDMTTFITKVTLGKEDLLCTVFDTDRLLYDLYGEAPIPKDFTQKFHSNKSVIFADDSKLLQKMARDTFEALGINYIIYVDGQALLDDLPNIYEQNVAVFLLDVEMPRKTGVDVIEVLRQDKIFKDTPVIVHTNMANSSITRMLKSYAVDKIISKVDFQTIRNTLKEYLS